MKDASYNVGIGTVFIAGTRYEDGIPDLKPQQTAVLVSQETVKMPDGHVGYALPRTTLCHNGVLTLSTGLIDPGYKGRISTIAINFDSQPVPLNHGDSFLRIVVHRLTDEAAGDPSRAIPDEEYYSKRKKESYSLPDTFLDLPRHIHRLSDQITQKQTNYFLLAIGMASVFIILFTQILSPLMADYETDIQRLQERVRTLESRDFVEEAGVPPSMAPVRSVAPSEEGTTRSAEQASGDSGEEEQ